VVGIASIITSIGKAREMCRMVRKLSPHSTIILGGHVTAIRPYGGLRKLHEGATFFVMDENLLLHRARAMQLLEHMKAAGKSRGVAVFASAKAIRKYSMQELVELGVSWIWMGLESVNSKHAKLEGKDTHELTHELREHGIRVQGSTIIGLEHHTPAYIAAEIEHAISHETDFHQLMLTRLFLVLLYIEK
jgi:hypothetical protein